MSRRNSLRLPSVTELHLSPPDAASSSALPWEAPDLFPLKPAGAGDYGYVARRRAVACTREQLIDAAARLDVPVGLVWTPDSPRLVAPEEVPFLFEAVRTREIKESEYSRRTALIHVLMWSALFFFYFFSAHQAPFIFLILLLAFGIVPAFQAITARRRLMRWTVPDMIRSAKSVRYGAWLGNRRIMSTWVLGGLIGVVLLAQFVAGLENSFAAAGLVKHLVRQEHQSWRLLTCVFLHGDILHFGFNFFALLVLGRLTEVHAHPIYVPIVFLFSAICGSLASLYVGPGDVSIGASGGLMGLIGFLMVMGYRRKEVLPPGFLKSILLSIAFIVAIGLIAPMMIDNAAHLGGLFGGTVLGLVYITRRREEKYRLKPSLPAKIAGGFCMIVLFAIAGLAVWKITTYVGTASLT